ncbi:FAD/NAD(P)-binding domain-containing protein [Patellaria atrata CBS 101060]|uniref:FAD/NAD(P)-binding domain-containing protein n=1 Tax=Patellaria atrata CBS 101060 TaxID=1346257 RepID=A0A9P4S5L0_9PEZI|nr:FAD/NAD(P)-binding domain-containing protein [Patellaria atrata CBS 101060]
MDVLVIGAGPSGLSAALALGRVLRSVVVFDSGEYRNKSSQHAHTVPTHDHKNPAEIRKLMKEELTTKYKTITFADTFVETVIEYLGVFEIRDRGGNVWKGRKLILATGSVDVFPQVPGYSEAWGKGIFHCLFCHGFEESGVRNAAALITSTKPSEINSAGMAIQLSHQFTRDLTILLNGVTELEEHEKIMLAKKNGVKVNTQPITQLKHIGPGGVTNVTFADGSTETFGFIVHHPETRLRGDFATQLGLHLTPTGDIFVKNVFQETSRYGVFAAGDCATMVKQVAIAQGVGVSAGIGANLQILQDDHLEDW